MIHPCRYCLENPVQGDYDFDDDDAEAMGGGGGGAADPMGARGTTGGSGPMGARGTTGGSGPRSLLLVLLQILTQAIGKTILVDGATGMPIDIRYRSKAVHCTACPIVFGAG